MSQKPTLNFEINFIWTHRKMKVWFTLAEMYLKLRTCPPQIKGLIYCQHKTIYLLNYLRVLLINFNLKRPKLTSTFRELYDLFRAWKAFSGGGCCEYNNPYAPPKVILSHYVMLCWEFRRWHKLSSVDLHTPRNLSTFSLADV